MTPLEPGALRAVRQGAFGAVGVVAYLALGVLMIITGSFALEAWFGWPDIVTIPLMIALAVFVPPVGGLVGLIGLAYLPIW